VTAFGIRKYNQQSFVFVEQNSVLRRILGITFAYINTLQTTAAIEGPTPNACDAVTNGHACQASASHEGAIPNAGDTVRDRHARQTTAEHEGFIPNAGDTVGDRHARQTTAGKEGPIPNAGDAVGDRHARQATAVSEGPIPNAGDAVGDRVVTAFGIRKYNQLGFVFVEQNSVLRRIFSIKIVYLNASQTTAAREGIPPNASEAAGDRHARQLTAFNKGILVNAGYRFTFIARRNF
jgi:hypothetical protein